jgi:hypothetical protein
MSFEESFLGISSAEIMGAKLKEVPGVSSESFIR